MPPEEPSELEKALAECAAARQKYYAASRLLQEAQDREQEAWGAWQAAETRLRRLRGKM